jgi:hypothetical protein
MFSARWPEPWSEALFPGYPKTERRIPAPSANYVLSDEERLSNALRREACRPAEGEAC